MSTESTRPRPTEAEAAPNPEAGGPSRSLDVTLAALAPIVFSGFLALAALGGLQSLGALLFDVSEPSFSVRVRYLAGALSSLLYNGLIGYVVSRFMLGLARLLKTQSEQADFLTRELTPTLRRLADTLERPRIVEVSADPERESARSLQAIREAIGGARWSEADALLRALNDHSAAPRLAEELAEARARATADLIAQLDAARGVNDPDRVLELRAALTPLLEGEPRRTLDRELAQWFLALIHKRLRGGTIRAELVLLAARVAEQFGDTSEGASLRASLPTLRRSVGLCPRCGQPYTGVDNACPLCLGAAPISALPPSPPNGNGTGPELKALPE